MQPAWAWPSTAPRVPDLRATARRNSLFYAPSAAELFGACRIEELILDVGAPYRITNPSIAARDGRLYGVVRAVNYILEGRTYTILDREQTVRTVNHFVAFDAQLSITQVRPMPDHSRAPRFPVAVRGFEDCRLFDWAGRWYCSASVCDTNPDRHVEIAVLTLDDSAAISAVAVNRDIEAQRTQKNWVPLVRDSELFFIYASDPTRILRFEPESGRFQDWAQSEPSVALDHARGGSQAIPFDGGWLYLVHEAVDGVMHTRVYLHRFLKLDRELRIEALTEPFFFLHRGVEFAAGLVHRSAEDSLLVSFGVADARAYLAELPAPALRDALQSV